MTTLWESPKPALFRFTDLWESSHVRCAGVLERIALHVVMMTLFQPTMKVEFDETVEEPDLEAYPLYATAPSLECVIAEGDMLFIPKSHWHYVRSLTASVSINFWF